VGGNRQQIEAITAEAARRGVTITVICDFVHVLELSAVSVHMSHVSAGHIVVAIDVTLLRR
jgi:hypothetical protein